jgi:hypothetical protein
MHRTAREWKERFASGKRDRFITISVHQVTSFPLTRLD